MRVEVRIMPKKEVLDPQGEAIRRVLKGLGYGDISGVRVGKLMMLEVEGADEAEVQARAEAACRELLANPIVEDYEVRLP